jgi:hypothetical protein
MVKLKVAVFLAICVQAAGAQDYTWDLVNALTVFNYPKVEEIIRAHAPSMSTTSKRTMVNFALSFTEGNNTLRVLRLLQRHDIHANAYDMYVAVNNQHNNDVIRFMMIDGIHPNGEIVLSAARLGRFDLVRLFADMGVDVNYRYSDNKNYADGMTSLLYAVKAGDFETVKLLVAKGADANIPAFDGSTALALARDAGRDDIYQFLKARGADAEPEQKTAWLRDVDAADAAASVIYPPSGYPAEQASYFEEPSRVERPRLWTLQPGKYRLTNGAAEVVLTGTETSGEVIYLIGGRYRKGGYLFTNNIITISFDNETYSYAMDSDTSFTGNNGEIWARVSP